MFDLKTNKEVTLTDKKVLQALKAIHRNKKRRLNTIGICGAVKRYLEDSSRHIVTIRDQDVLHRLMKDWPKHSGVTEFPICAYGVDPMKEFITCMDMWNQKTPYGQLRWELLEWLINKLENENVNQNPR